MLSPEGPQHADSEELFKLVRPFLGGTVALPCHMVHDQTCTWWQEALLMRRGHLHSDEEHNCALRREGFWHSQEGWQGHGRLPWSLFTDGEHQVASCNQTPSLCFLSHLSKTVLVVKGLLAAFKRYFLWKVEQEGRNVTLNYDTQNQAKLAKVRKHHSTNCEHLTQWVRELTLC